MKYQKRNYLLPVLILLLAIVSATTLSYAAYTTRNYKKGIIQASNSQPLFTSDVLSAADGKTEYVPVSENENFATAKFTLYNYPVGSPDLYCRENIEYTLSFSGAQASIGGVSVSSEDGTLSGGSASQQAYTVQFPKNGILTVTAAPKNHAIAHTDSISCVFVAVASSSQTAITSGVTGTFVDENVDINQCQAFHYRLSLLAHSGTVTLQVNNSGLRMLAAEGTVQENTWTYTAGTSETKDFEFVFYRTGYEEESLTWEIVRNSVVLTF